jgi:hypothetical protein
MMLKNKLRANIKTIAKTNNPKLGFNIFQELVIISLFEKSIKFPFIAGIKLKSLMLMIILFSKKFELITC